MQNSNIIDSYDFSKPLNPNSNKDINQEFIFFL